MVNIARHRKGKKSVLASTQKYVTECRFLRNCVTTELKKLYRKNNKECISGINHAKKFSFFLNFDLEQLTLTRYFRTGYNQQCFVWVISISLTIYNDRISTVKYEIN